MSFKNSPHIDGEQGTIKRYVHQPLTNDHYGIHFSIQENGKIIIRGVPDKEGVYDEVEIPASLVFKLATLLKATRTVTFVDVGKD